jgi:murein L,D-transpeptidase YcbB/YkuD
LNAAIGCRLKMTTLGLALVLGAGSSQAIEPPPPTNFLDPTLTPAQQLIYDAVSQLRDGGQLEVHGEPIASTVVLPDFYSRQHFARAWTDSKAATLLRAIEESEKDGLDPKDYHQGALVALRSETEGGSTTESTLAEYDLLLTDALIRLAYHHLFGKVDVEAMNPNWNLSRQINDVDPAEAIARAIGGDLAEEIERLKPKSVLYRRLRDALSNYRQLAAQGGWSPVPAGAPLKPGAAGDPRVPLLRQRLATEGDLLAIGGADSSTAYDDSLVAAVERFQARHGLAADGVIGANTIAVMNVPVADRIDQIRVNMERCRWVLREAHERFVVTNIASFQVFYFEAGKIRWRSRCQVGKEARQTPIFGAAIQHVELNPTWTVPPTIFAKDILPAVRRDAGYLAQRGLRVIDARGKTIPAGNINWATVTPRNFPYMLRQDPGPNCALGRVKFVSPNPHAVYLHDTPSQELFNADRRAFSSGCIRVENPLELARLLIDDSRWTAETIAATVKSEKTTPVVLREPVPVYFLYFTATAPEGQAHLFRDIYELDPPILAALGREFSFRSRPVFTPTAQSGGAPTKMTAGE